jgi:hypothetical protein
MQAWTERRYTMIRFLKKRTHAFVRRHIHTPWMYKLIHVWAGVKTFIHSFLVVIGFVAVFGHSVTSTIQAVTHWGTFSGGRMRLLEMNLATASWGDLMILAALPSAGMAIWSILTAWRTWHHWAHCGHTWDHHLSHPHEDDRYVAPETGERATAS